MRRVLDPLVFATLAFSTVVAWANHAWLVMWYFLVLIAALATGLIWEHHHHG
jgi:hypothetical protein